MAQHDQNIANQGYSATRADINSALAALFSNNSGATEPSTRVAGMTWLDTSTTPNVFKVRNRDNSAWLPLFQLDTAVSRIGFAASDGIDVVGTAPTIRLNQTDAATNEKVFEIAHDQASGNLQVRSLTDANATGTTAMEFVRNGINFDGVRFDTPIFGSIAFAASGGVANAYTATIPVLGASPTIPDSYMLSIRIPAANTGACTLAINGGTARSIVKNSNQALVSGDLPLNFSVILIWDNANTRWQMVGTTVTVAAATTSTAGIVQLGTAAEVQTGTDANKVSAISTMGSHLGVAKVWATALSSGSLGDSYGLSSMVRNGAGDFSLNFSTAFANTGYAVTGMATNAGSCTTVAMISASYGKTTSSCRVWTAGTCDSGFGLFDANLDVAIFGRR